MGQLKKCQTAFLKKIKKNTPNYTKKPSKQRLSLFTKKWVIFWKKNICQKPEIQME